MATLATVTECEKRNQQRGLKRLVENGNYTHYPNLVFLGIEEVIDMSKPVKISEASKRRHEREDAMLRFMYVEN